MKKIVIMLTCFIFINVLSICPQASNIDNELDVNEIILNAGVEAEVLEAFSQEDKEIIANAILNEGAVYNGTSSSYFELDEGDSDNPEDDQFKEVNPLMRATISSADLKLSVSTFYANSKYYITGTYEWKKAKFLNIAEHVFTMALPTGWKIDTATMRLNTWYTDFIYIEDEDPNKFAPWTLIDSVVKRAYDIGDSSVTWSSLSFKGTVIPYNINKRFRGSATIQTRKIGDDKHVKLQYGYSTDNKNITVSNKNGYGVTYSSGAKVNQATEEFSIKK